MTRSLSQLPATMQAIAITQPGGPEVMSLQPHPVPEPGPSDVLIQVAAAGVNRPDIVQRQGFYPAPPGAPEIPGLEIAGIISAIGSSVDSLKVGDKVCALVAGGGYGDYCVAAETSCLPIPKGYTFIQAAALPETFFTVWSNIFDRAGLQSGERFLVHGGTSGIGTTAIQLAKAFGAKVITTAGSEEKCATCTKLGADLAINYKTHDFVEVIKEAEGGVDVILDMVGGDYLSRNIKCLNPDGRHVSIAFLAGSKAEVNFLPVMLKRLTLTGSTLRVRSNDFKSEIAKALQTQVWPLLEAGTVAPLVDSVYPLDQAAAAHAHMESGAHQGKIILEVGE